MTLAETLEVLYHASEQLAEATGVSPRVAQQMIGETVLSIAGTDPPSTIEAFMDTVAIALKARIQALSIN